MNISELAKDINASESDLIFLAKSVASSLTDDGASDYFINTDEEGRKNLCDAYLPFSVKKSRNFECAYRTSEEFKNELNNFVFHSLKKQETRTKYCAIANRAFFEVS